MFSLKKKDKENEVKNVNENQEEIKNKKKMKPLKKVAHFGEMNSLLFVQLKK